MEKIYKYPMQIAGIQELDLPFGAKVLTIQSQGSGSDEVPVLWAIVQPEVGETQTRTFRTIGTGHPIEDDADLGYIGTYQLANGAFVGHVFEVF